MDSYSSAGGSGKASGDLLVSDPQQKESGKDKIAGTGKRSQQEEEEKRPAGKDEEEKKGMRDSSLTERKRDKKALAK